jgi:CheY-like chemotaxis protein
LEISTVVSSLVSPVHVVVVEDSLPDVMLVEEALREQAIPYSLTHFKDGVDALQGLTTQTQVGALPDLIVLDLNMPRMGGLELLANLKGNGIFRDVPVVILTSSLQPEEKEEAHRLGATGFVRKPVDLYDFLQEVGRALRELLAKPGSARPS